MADFIGPIEDRFKGFAGRDVRGCVDKDGLNEKLKIQISNDKINPKLQIPNSKSFGILKLGFILKFEIWFSKMNFYLFIFTFLLLSTVSCGGTSTPSGDSKAQEVGGSQETVDSIGEMEVGNLYFVDFDKNGAAAIDFSGAPAGAEYTFILQTTEIQSSQVSIGVTDVSQALDKFLRGVEANLASSNLPAISADYSISKTVGDTAQFRVLTSITSTSNYTEINATLVCSGTHVNLYIDQEVYPSGGELDDSDLADICEEFEYAYTVETGILGGPSDVNGDSRVTALLTPAVNRLGMTGGGIITGFFFASDLYDRTESNPTSNDQEIVYMLVPDSAGNFGVAVEKEFVLLNLLPAVFPHELQHAVSYNQHVFVNGGASESDWLNEAMSHFIEDLTGFGRENPSRVEVFLLSPADAELMVSAPDLASRGAGFLFLRYLYEQASDGNSFLGSLVNTSLTGADNIEAAFNGRSGEFDEMDEFMRRFAIAVALTDQGISDDTRYTFRARELDATTGNWKGVCILCVADDGRETILSGPSFGSLSSDNSISLSGTATTFYRLESPPSRITISATPSAGLQGVVIRKK